MFDARDWIDSAEERLGTRPGHGWYLAQLKPNALAIARRNLTAQNFPIFAPMQIETRRVRGLFRTEPRLLFPGYLFISLDPRDGHWRAVNSTPGVTRVVSFGGMPAAVPRGLVEQIALGCGPDGVLLALDILAPGDRVLVSSGPFAGVLAEVERSEADKRVWILLDLMGQAVRTQVGRDVLRRA